MALTDPHLHLPAGLREDRVEAAVLVLHGGREASLDPVRANQLAVLRLISFANQLSHRGHGRVAVARLRYRVRGWNAGSGAEPAPVQDAYWALRQLTERFPDRPIALVGHSMGGRTASRVAGHPAVRSMVGLAPWLPASEPIEQLAGRRVLLVHGSSDRMTSPRATAAFAQRLERAGTQVGLVEISGDGHAMLRRPKLWHELSTQFVLSTLLSDYQPSGWTGAPNFLHELMRVPARISY